VLLTLFPLLVLVPMLILILILILIRILMLSLAPVATPLLCNTAPD
jgi:hypothetical protein